MLEALLDHCSPIWGFMNQYNFRARVEDQYKVAIFFILLSEDIKSNNYNFTVFHPKIAILTPKELKDLLKNSPGKGV